MATKNIQGAIGAFKFTELPEPDKYDNTHRASVKVGEEWVGFGSVKGDNLRVKENGEWVRLEKGDVVIIKATENERGFLNAKRSDVMLLEKASASSAPSQTGPTTNSSGGSRGSQTKTASNSLPASNSGGVDWARKDAGAAASASVDKALRYLSLKGESLYHPDHIDYNVVLNIAREMQSIVKTLAEEILHPPVVKGEEEKAPARTLPKESKPARSGPRRQAAPPPEPEDNGEFQDDDLPWD